MCSVLIGRLSNVGVSPVPMMCTMEDRFEVDGWVAGSSIMDMRFSIVHRRDSFAFVSSGSGILLPAVFTRNLICEIDVFILLPFIGVNWNIAPRVRRDGKDPFLAVAVWIIFFSRTKLGVETNSHAASPMKESLRNDATQYFEPRETRVNVRRRNILGGRRENNW